MRWLRWTLSPGSKRKGPEFTSKHLYKCQWGLCGGLSTYVYACLSEYIHIYVCVCAYITYDNLYNIYNNLYNDTQINNSFSKIVDMAYSVLKTYTDVS